ncbi:PH domain-containing protein [Neobacillus sp. NPDC097160]|uniref:PH domain-containing protein n=1 Tax=Neobacillus sp. NPDC097160 TaxID=3364298 RepID=UPI00381D1430
MDHFINSLLSPDEQKYSSITATFELQELAGVNYKFGTLIATDKRLIWYTKHPLGWRETNIYKYRDIIDVDETQSLITFNNEVSIKVKLINLGNMKHFLKTIKYFSTYIPGIRNYYNISLEG